MGINSENAIKHSISSLTQCKYATWATRYNPMDFFFFCEMAAALSSRTSHQTIRLLNGTHLSCQTLGEENPNRAFRLRVDEIDWFITTSKNKCAHHRPLSNRFNSIFLYVFTTTNLQSIAKKYSKNSTIPSYCWNLFPLKISLYRSFWCTIDAFFHVPTDESLKFLSRLFNCWKWMYKRLDVASIHVANK